jgi:epidermal growth factor receptor substrate 15
VPPLTPDRVAEYARLFERAGPQNSILSGETIKASWLHSGLPDSVLSHVWNLADTEQRGGLGVTEFIIAMHLLTSYKNKQLTALPPNIPAGLYEAASRRPSIISARTPGAAPIPRQTSGPPAQQRTPTGRQFTPPVSAEWLVTAREKASYDNLFEKVDSQHLGYITGDQAVVFFTESGLPAPVLAQIWDLANIRRIDQLNRDEFAVAMYLIRKKGRSPQEDLPAEVPPNLIPPSLRGASAQASETPIAPLPPAPQRSNTEDLFGLDAFSSSPPQQLKQETTGGSNTFNQSVNSPFGDTSSSRSLQNATQTTGEGFFKSSWAPSSSFGQSLVTQSTGASVASSNAPKQQSLMDDLLLDTDPDVNRKIAPDSSDIGNMQNEVNSLRSQMQNVQTKKATTENELASSSGQKRELEVRLQQFRSQYQQEASGLKALEDQLNSEKSEINSLSQKAALAHASVQDVQGKHREAQAQLQSILRDKDTVQQRLRQMNEYIAQTQPEVDKLQADIKQQRGLLAINKKQADKLEEEKAQLDKMKSELTELSKAESAAAAPPPVSRDGPPSAAASPTPSVASSTNPFMRKNTQTSIDNKITPSGFSRTASTDSKGFDSLFSQAFSPPTSAPPPTSFRQDAFAHSQSGPSIKSSEPDVPTPSTSPPLSSYQESPRLPPPPASRQITSKDLPLSDKQSESAATSVRVETPMSRYDINTPTNIHSPQPNPLERTTSTGASLFERAANTSSPVASLGSDVTKKDTEPIDMFSSFPTGEQAKEAPPQQENARSNPFTFPAPPRASTGSKGDIEAAFASVGKSQSRQPTLESQGGNDPVAKFKSQFPDLKPKDEFPPITDLAADESDTETDLGGFDDDFTKTSSPQVKTRSTARKPSNDLDTFFSNNPLPEAPAPPKAAATSGEALFGPKGTGSAITPGTSSSMFPTSRFPPPPLNASDSHLSALSDTYESAVSQQTGSNETNHTSSPTEVIAAPIATAPHAAAKFGGFDDFDDGFEDLADAKEADERAEDDLMFGSHHGEEDFSAAFDSPSASASHLAKSTASKAPTFGHDDGNAFGDFETNFGNASGKKKATNDWDVMMKGIDDHHTPGDEHEGMVFPEAPEPPRPSAFRQDTTEHDDPILKRVTAMGYSRLKALGALEKYDYDLDKVR